MMDTRTPAPADPQPTSALRAALEAYVPVRPHFPHQREALVRGATKRAFGLFMEQGLGKSKVLIDNCALLYSQGVINALLLLAPNDVHEQFVDEQFAAHWPKAHALRAAVWDAGSARAVRECTELASKPLPSRFHVLAMNHDAMATKRGRSVAEKFLRTYKAMFAIDESHAIKTPKAARTRAVLRLAPLAPVRRILTGTPKTQSPFDFYTQMQFLDPRILGFDSYVAFKARYGLFVKGHVRAVDKRTGKSVLREFDQLQSYQRLEELNARMDKHVYRARKKDCMNLPEKIPVTRYVTMSDAQREAYDRLKEEGLLLMEAAENGATTATHAGITRFLRMDALTEEELAERAAQNHGRVTLKIKLVLELRLQQILGGFVTDDAGTSFALDPPEKIPRIKALADVVAETLDASDDNKVLVWAVFRAELDAIHRVLNTHTAPGAVACIHGGTGRAARAEAIAAFKDPNNMRCRVLAAHPRTLGTGMDFTCANAAWYYSNSPSWVLRAQSEDRIHRIGMRGAVTIGDFLTRPGVRADATRLSVLKGHGDMADFFMNRNAQQLKHLL